MTALKTYSRTDLTRRTREILEAVRSGSPAVIESYGREQAVVLDPLDYRLLRALAGLLVGHSTTESELADLLRSYLDDETSLAKVADELGLSRFELMERFERLGVPLHLGPPDLEAARREVSSAIRHR